MIIIIYNNINKRHDFIYLFDVKDGNPNGDPDSNNMPRIDPETMQGLVTDVCLKRKVRNYVSMTHDKNIFISNNSILYNKQKQAYDNIEQNEKEDSRNQIQRAQEWLCSNFYDVRMFGAVMNTKKYNCGQIQGPMQLTFARSIDSVTPMDITITRVAVTKETDNKSIDMGNKSVIPYGLYMGYGFYNPYLAENNYIKDNDLKLFWDSLLNMWNIQRSANKGLISCKGIYIFTHENKKGNKPAYKLFNKLNINKKNNVNTPRDINDYQINLDNNIPDDITVNILN